MSGSALENTNLLGAELVDVAKPVSTIYRITLLNTMQFNVCEALNAY